MTRRAALSRLTSPIPMSLCKELETSVFRCQELLSDLCQLRRHLFSQCHMETLHLRRHSCRFLQRSWTLLLRTLTRIPYDHAPTQFDEESAVDTQSDDPFQFDDPPVPAPVILSQSNPVCDHRDDLPHHIRTQLQSRIRKPAQNLEPDAKRLRLDAGKRAVLMLFHDVSSGPDCCKPLTKKNCENSGCADVLLTRRAASRSSFPKSS